MIVKDDPSREPVRPHPRLLAARALLREEGLRLLYEASATHPLGFLRLELWGGQADLRLLRSIEVGEVLALRLFTLLS